MARSFINLLAWVLMKFLVEHTGNKWYWSGVAFHLLFVPVVIAVASVLNGCARKDEEVSKVWCIWLTYIIYLVHSRTNSLKMTILGSTL